jgi:predicted HNH restriction endonuclease
MKKLPYTPRSRVRSAIRQLWLRSRERAAAIKASGRKCQECGVKASVAKGREQKLEVHHIAGIGDWEKIIDQLYSELLVGVDKLKVVCHECHNKIHSSQKD